MVLSDIVRLHVGLHLCERWAAVYITIDHLDMLNLAKNERHKATKVPTQIDQNSCPEPPVHLYT